jgi:CheY-like chemotaxis protein
LSIAKENTELLRGKIYLDSEKGKGTTFYVSIPFKPVYTDKITNDMEGGQDKEKTKSDKKTILIVEDEEVNVIYIETILETEMELNYQLLYAKNGLEAVEICKSNPEIDLVLMDIKMPVMNGYEATEKIREFRPELTIIAQTAYSTPKDKEKAFDAGCNEFISKPLDEELLKMVLNNYLTE